MLLVISFKRLETVRDYSLESSFERLETVRNYSLPQQSIPKFRNVSNGFELFETIWKKLSVVITLG